ncbi:unnamed protein product [Chrysodeixis includens]|uniref:Uncharacterized protein n=1 Tax=Chrysodeixis includens TaxID=689277 RepID=A0A9N8KX77_CHRIL|nr:unnamed protein product [Chrysodeixis includens]
MNCGGQLLCKWLNSFAYFLNKKCCNLAYPHGAMNVITCSHKILLNCSLKNTFYNLYQRTSKNNECYIKSLITLKITLKTKNNRLTIFNLNVYYNKL